MRNGESNKVDFRVRLKIVRVRKENMGIEGDGVSMKIKREREPVRVNLTTEVDCENKTRNLKSERGSESRGSNRTVFIPVKE